MRRPDDTAPWEAPPAVAKVPSAHGQNRITREARLAAAQIVDDPDYRAMMLERAKKGLLHPGVEMMLWYYRYGKPKDVFEIQPSGQSSDLRDASAEELAARAQLIAEELLKAKEFSEQAEQAADRGRFTSSTKTH
jgi:hypothetical protein